MSISVKTRKMLWGRSANRCNFPDCRKELSMDIFETDDISLIGEECHIIAREFNGPRGQSDLTSEQRDKYNNLILLCNIHHKVIDDQPTIYSAERLCQLKAGHEAWVKASLDYDKIKQRDDEVYSEYIETWSNYVDIENWNVWTSYLLSSGQPKIFRYMDEKLCSLREWMLSRIWPQRYGELEASFENFRLVLEDLCCVFNEHTVEHNNMTITEKFYKIHYWDTKLYDELLNQYLAHVDLVEDLVLELTRAANYICDNIRKYILHNYRLSEGALLVTYGPNADLSYTTLRPEYRDNERVLRPYSGLTEFKTVRAKRDFHFGDT